MPSGRLKTIARRLADLEAGLEAKSGKQEISLHWIPPDPPGPDEELFLEHEERMASGWFRIFDKRPKEKPKETNDKLNTQPDHTAASGSTPRKRKTLPRTQDGAR